MAGAAIKDVTVEEAESMLIGAIDKYYESIESETQN